jgi:hypothetical protein
MITTLLSPEITCKYGTANSVYKLHRQSLQVVSTFSLRRGMRSVKGLVRYPPDYLLVPTLCEKLVKTPLTFDDESNTALWRSAGFSKSLSATYSSTLRISYNMPSYSRPGYLVVSCPTLYIAECTIPSLTVYRRYGAGQATTGIPKSLNYTTLQSEPALAFRNGMERNACAPIDRRLVSSVV